ncbi:unnamed protein product [Lymnaea stagnalis]|uniref:Uncharacterized protein n=1 Tax=Lymnaea stagnalis TaxID=6523 RepID=A0AAV2HPG2_LYMST
MYDVMNYITAPLPNPFYVHYLSPPPPKKKIKKIHEACETIMSPTSNSCSPLSSVVEIYLLQIQLPPPLLSLPPPTPLPFLTDRALDANCDVIIRQHVPMDAASHHCGGDTSFVVLTPHCGGDTPLWW